MARTGLAGGHYPRRRHGRCRRFTRLTSLNRPPCTKKVPDLTNFGEAQQRPLGVSSAFASTPPGADLVKPPAGWEHGRCSHRGALSHGRRPRVVSVFGPSPPEMGDGRTELDDRRRRRVCPGLADARHFGHGRRRRFGASRSRRSCAPRTPSHAAASDERTRLGFVGAAAPILRTTPTPAPPLTSLAHRTAGGRASLSTRGESNHA